MAKDNLIKVQLVKSLIGVPEKQRKVVRALGLRKMWATRTHKDEPSIRGMIFKVNHLLKVERVEK